jgi:hypothetical protein
VVAAIMMISPISSRILQNYYYYYGYCAVDVRRLCLISGHHNASDMKLRQTMAGEHTNDPTLYATFQRSARFFEDVRALVNGRLAS